MYKNWLKCAGENYMYITITNLRTNEEKMLYGDLTQVPVNLSFKKSYTYTEIPVRDAMLGLYDDTFTPISLEVSGRVTGDNELFKRFIRDKTTLYKLAMKDFYVYFRIPEDTSNLNTVDGKESIQFTINTVSNFIKEQEYEYETSTDDGIHYEGFDYTFDRPLSGKSSNSYEEGSLEIDIDGDTDAYMRIEIYGEANNPGFGLEANPDNTVDSYQSKDLIVPDGESLVVNSHPLKTYIRRGNTNVEQYREFRRHKTYLQLKRDTTNTLYFKNTFKASVIVYEQYYNLP